MKEYLKKIIKVLKKYNLRNKYNKKILKLITLNNLSSLENAEKVEILKFWKKYLKGRKINEKWHIYYKKFNKFDEKYIPEDIFYEEIEPKCNSYFELTQAYNDKNYHDLLYPNLKKPKVVLKNINGIFYDSDMNILLSKEVERYLKKQQDTTLIIKPSLDSAGAKNVNKIRINKDYIFFNNEKKYWSDLLKIYKKDFLIQEIVTQSEELNKIYNKSLNTLRFMTYRDGEEFDILSIIIRIGDNGAEVDNLVKGGFGVGINKITGKLNKFGVDKSGKIIKEKHPETGYRFADFEIPNWQNILKNIEEWSKAIPPYFKLCSWDIGIDYNNNPIFIECNLDGQEINFHQVNNGPLFGNKTEYYLNKILKETNHEEN